MNQEKKAKIISNLSEILVKVAEDDLNGDDLEDKLTFKITSIFDALNQLDNRFAEALSIIEDEEEVAVIYDKLKEILVHVMGQLPRVGTLVTHSKAAGACRMADVLKDKEVGNA
jgi:hypothetical protein